MSSSRRSQDPRNQITAGGFLALWSAAGWWSAIRTPALWSEDYGVDPGPALLPTLVLTILSLGALTLIVSGTRRILAESTHQGYWSRLRLHTLVPAFFVASLLVYVTAIRFIGFVPASSVFAFLWMVALGFKSGEGAPRVLVPLAAAGTLIGVGLIYFVFVYLIGVPLE